MFGKEITWILGLHINSVIASINYSLDCFGGLRLLRNKHCPSVKLHASCALLSRTSLSTCGSQILLCTTEQAKALLKGEFITSSLHFIVGLPCKDSEGFHASRVEGQYLYMRRRTSVLHDFCSGQETLLIYGGS